MAINEDTSRRNQNTLYLAVSGGGKSQALLQRSGIPEKGARVLLWDPNKDHPAVRVSGSIQQFAATVVEAIKATEAGEAKGFRLAWEAEETPDHFDAFCKVAMGALDGRHTTYVVLEEVGTASDKVAKADANVARLINQARKYGGILHCTSQRPEEIPKTFYTQGPIKWVGQQATQPQRRKMAREIDVSESDIKGLDELEFFVHDGSASEAQRVQLSYKKRPPDPK